MLERLERLEALFPAYLQGMETRQQSSATRCISWFPAYLQGMETGLPGKPYSEPCRAFPAYLQGMETGVPGRQAGPGTPFPAYLQGMETGIRWLA